MGTGIAALDNLALLLGGKGPNDTNPFGMPTPRGIMANTQPGAQPTAQPGVQPGARPNPVSDDPTIAPPMPAAQPAAPPPVTPPQTMPIPTAPTLHGPDMTAINGLQSKIAAASAPVTRADHPASMWQKILSVPLAGLVGGVNGTEAGIGVGNKLLSKNYDRAAEQQRQQLDPLYKQMEMQEKMLPFSRQANENAQDTFKDKLDSNKAFREQQAADETQSTRAPEMRTDKDGTEHFWYKTRGGEEYEGAAPPGHENAARRAEEDKNTPAVGARPEKDPGGGLRVKTKAGGWMPYTAKSIDEGAMLGDKTSTALYNRAHPGRADKEEKKATPGQFSKVQNDRDKGWDDAHKEYAKAVSALSPKDTEGLKAARQEFYDQRQEVQDQYEDQIGTLGGEPAHTALPRNIFGEEQPAPGGAAPAAAAQANSAPKTVTKDVVQKYADAHKMTFAQAQKGFQSKNYKIQ